MTEGQLWISEADVETLVDPLALIQAVEDGFLAVEAGAIREPGSTRLNGLDGDSAYLTLYPAHREQGLTTAKILAGRPANARENRPEIDAIVAVMDPPTGRLVALMSGRALTALRTAAATTAVLRRLMRGTPARIALIGTGGQARAHARLLAAGGLATGFLVASPRGDAAKAEAVAAAMQAQLRVEARSSTLAEASDCDVIIALSLAEKPIVQGHTRKDAIIASIGCFYPHAHEIDPTLVAGAASVVSDDPARLRRQWASSPLLDVNALTLASVGDLLAARVQPRVIGRRVFLSDGRAFQDNVAATLIYEAAIKRGSSRRLD